MSTESVMPSTISYPVAPFSSCPQSFGSFPVELYPMSRYLKNYQSSKNLLNKIVSILLNCHTFFITWKARCKPRNSRTCGFQHKPQPVSLLCPRSAPHMISHTPAWPPHPAHPHHIHACTDKCPSDLGAPRDGPRTRFTQPWEWA